MAPRIDELPKAALEEFCRRNHIRRLSVFGSILRDDFRPDSDVDVMVEFEPGKTPGLSFFLLPQELEPILGRHVDLTTRSAVESGENPIRRRAILESAREVYAAR